MKLSPAQRAEGAAINARHRRDPAPWARPWPWGYLHRWGMVRRTMAMRWPPEALAALEAYL